MQMYLEYFSGMSYMSDPYILKQRSSAGWNPLVHEVHARKRSSSDPYHLSATGEKLVQWQAA
jgi:hypothetical protein